MEQQIVGGILSQGPWAALFVGVGILLWKFVQKQIEDMKTQHAQQIADLKEEAKSQQEYLMTELSRRDADMSVEMDKRDKESQAREDRLYAMLEKSNEVITGDLQDIKSAIERSERFR